MKLRGASRRDVGQCGTGDFPAAGAGGSSNGRLPAFAFTRKPLLVGGVKARDKRAELAL